MTNCKYVIKERERERERKKKIERKRDRTVKEIGRLEKEER